MTDRTEPALFPKGHSYACTAGHRCREGVVAHNGRFYITFGHCGFNSTHNNGWGYATEAVARRAISAHERPAFRATVNAFDDCIVNPPLSNREG